MSWINTYSRKAGIPRSVSGYGQSQSNSGVYRGPTPTGSLPGKVPLPAGLGANIGGKNYQLFQTPTSYRASLSRPLRGVAFGFTPSGPMQGDVTDIPPGQFSFSMEGGLPTGVNLDNYAFKSNSGTITGPGGTVKNPERFQVDPDSNIAFGLGPGGNTYGYDYQKLFSDLGLPAPKYIKDWAEYNWYA